MCGRVVSVRVVCVLSSYRATCWQHVPTLPSISRTISPLSRRRLGCFSILLANVFARSSTSAINWPMTLLTMMHYTYYNAYNFDLALHFCE